MRYQNTRYGCPGELEHYAKGRTIKQLAKHLKRSERTIKDWLEQKKRIPFWVPELLRLQHNEHLDRLRQMNLFPIRTQLGIISGDIIKFPIKTDNRPPAPASMAQSPTKRPPTRYYTKSERPQDHTQPQQQTPPAPLKAYL